MLNNMSIGQYYPGNTLIHRIDPRAKIVFVFLFIISLFLINTFTPYLFIGLGLFGVIKASKVPVKFIVKGLKPILFIIIFTFLINVFMTRGEIIVSLGPLNITKEGLYQAGFMAIRLIFLIMGTSLLTLTTSPIALTDGIEHLLNPMKRIGVPAHELAMMMTIALRFIPTLLEETDKIMKAQKARGADFETGGLMKRAKNLIPLLVPLFISAFRRADELAMAMEARCYHGGEGRTRMKQLSFEKKDYIASAVMALYCVAIIVNKVI
ncbi:MAG: energy-coupling factor transporter transmembrane protein EcfT [Tissierellales bacterium]|jgi:energy-coupling factor transport system permease protein|nr:energy-coupling factor transporter transmembrane protein EcfT [Tissierellales bacterium]